MITVKNLISKGGILDTKISLKSGNPPADFHYFSGNCKKGIFVYSNRCTQTKVSDKVFRLY